MHPRHPPRAASVPQAPRADAKELLGSRFPVPRYVQCNQGHSQERFLLAKVNPSLAEGSESTQQGQGRQAGTVFTDDVSLQVFMNSLKKLASKVE